MRAEWIASLAALLPAAALAQTPVADCPATVQALAISHPHLRCSCPAENVAPDCDDGRDSGGSSSRGGGHHRATGPSFEQQLAMTAMSAFLNAFSAWLQSPPGPSAQELQAQAKRRWAEYEAARREAEKKRSDRAFAAGKKDALALLSGRPAPPPSDGIPEDGVPALLRGDWRKGALTPGLSQKARSAMRLNLPVDDSTASVAGLEDILREREKLQGPAAPPRVSPALALVEGSVTYGVGAFLEQGAEGLLVRSYGERALQFGDAYAIGGVAMAVVKGSHEEAAPPAVNWALSKIPGAGLGVGTAQGVAAVTTTVMRRSWDQFLEESEKVVPGVLPEGGAAKFWSEMKGDLTTGQRSVMEVLGL